MPLVLGGVGAVPGAAGVPLVPVPLVASLGAAVLRAVGEEVLSAGAVGADVEAFRILRACRAARAAGGASAGRSFDSRRLPAAVGAVVGAEVDLA